MRGLQCIYGKLNPILLITFSFGKIENNGIVLNYSKMHGMHLFRYSLNPKMALTTPLIIL